MWAEIRRVVKMSAIPVLVSAVAVLGGPVVTLLAVTVVALLLASCWVLNDHRRTGRLVKVIRAVRGSTSSPAEHG